jgi:hypothetical protein
MNPFRQVYIEQLKGGQHKLDADKDGKIEGEDLAKLRASKKVKKEAAEIPFSGPYTKTPAVVTDKSGAKHSPMSRVRHLARAAAATAAKKAEKTVKEDIDEGTVPDNMKGKQKPYVSSDGKGNYEVLGNTGQTKATFSRKEHGMDAQKKAQQHLKKNYDSYMKEEVEELDELTKSTLASYAKKATKDARMQQSIGKDFEAQANKSRKSSMKDAAQSLADKYKSKSRSREAGIGKAIDRLAKEELTVESDKAYADAMEKQKEKMLTQKDQDALSKVRALMAKEKAAKMKKEETDLEEGIIKGTIETGKQAIKVPLKAAKRVVKGVAAAVGGVVDTAKDVKDGVKTIVKKFKEETEQIEEKSDQAKQNKTMKNLMVASKGAQINRGLKLDPADYGYKKAQHLNKAIGRAAMKEEETQMEFTQEELQLIEQFIEIAEKMNLSKATMGDVIKDFKKSDAPQFKGKSEEKKRQMAIAAKLSADREAKKEEVETTLSFKSYLDEVKMADLPARKVTGRGYGTEYYKKEKEKDEKGYDADDDKEPSEKKGRGRPAGSKSGARQKGSTTGKKKSGVEMTGYPLHLPNR